MSDSLKDTVIIIEPELTISAKGELELLEPVEDALELPRLPAVDEPPTRPVPLVEEELDDELELDAPEVVDPALTASPGRRPDIDTIVPLVGAASLVSERVCSALWTLSSALYTDASAEAMLAGEGVVVVWVPEPDPFLVEDLLGEELVCEGLVLAWELPGGGPVRFGVVVVVVVVVVLVGPPGRW